MKFSPAVEAPQIVVLGAMFAIAITCWSSAPARIPVHWGAGGYPERYGGKMEGLLVTPLVAVIVYAGCYLLQTLLARRPQLIGPWVLLRFAFLAVFVAGYALILSAIRVITIPAGIFIFPVIALLALAFIKFMWRAVSLSRS
jgi:hypothetical protein